MASAWLLAKRHDVTVYEKASRLGGHSNTVEVEKNGIRTAVDTGFIVYNEPCYPNLSAMFRHFEVPTRATDMSLAVSLDDGALEYGGEGLNTLFAQRGNVVSPRFWSMLRDLVRFYRLAPRHLGQFGAMSIGDWLDKHAFGRAFRDDHLMPMAAAIWSAPAAQLLAYPAEAFVQFCENHGLLRFVNRPQWRTVAGGSIEYVKKLTSGFGTAITVLPGAVSLIRESSGGVAIRCANDETARYDAVVIATHADEALALLDDPSDEEQELLQAFRYSDNRALLHSDPSLMPHRRAVWSSWNYLGRRNAGDGAGPLTNVVGAVSADAARSRGELKTELQPDAQAESQTLCLTYWMNRLQHLDPALPLFVTLNPERDPVKGSCHYETSYSHPIFNLETLAAQKRLWNLQGRRGTWFCGSYFGAGFHEDGLQAGLAVAEQLGGVMRPWQLVEPSTRIHLLPNWPPLPAGMPSPLPALAGVSV
jgi:predicted NAD/FAD-binding protein